MLLRLPACRSRSSHAGRAGALLAGALHKIRIEHDNAGFGAGWLLDHVEVCNMATDHRWTFPCGQWLDKKRGDGQTGRELMCRD